MAHFMVRQASPQSTENKNNAVFSVGAVFLVISTAGMAARLASKKMKRTPFFVDDVLVIWAYVSYRRLQYWQALTPCIDFVRWGDWDDNLGYFSSLLSNCIVAEISPLKLPNMLDLGIILRASASSRLYRSRRYYRGLRTIDEHSYLNDLGLLFCIADSAVSARINEVVNLNLTLSYLHNKGIPDNCAGTYGHCRLLVDLDLLRRCFHLLSSGFAMESGSSRPLWQSIPAEHH